MTTPVLFNYHRLFSLALAAWLVVSLSSLSWAEKGEPIPVSRPSGTVFNPPGAPGFVMPLPPGMNAPEQGGPQSPAPGQPGYVEEKRRPPAPPVFVQDQRHPPKAYPAPPPGIIRKGPPPPQENRRPPAPPVFVQDQHHPPRGYPVPPPGIIQKGPPHHPPPPRREPPPKYHRDYGHVPWDYHHRPHYGSVHRHLPYDTHRFFLGGVPFFYIGGVYFQSAPSGYVVVAPPIGARIRVLPEGCNFFYFHGRRCYSCDDVFYEELDNEYVVIERPPRFRLIAEAGDEILVETDTLNVRSGPGRKYDTINLLHRDETAEVGAVDGDWYYVNLRDGSYGWIMREYTRIIRFGEEPKG